MSWEAMLNYEIFHLGDFHLKIGNLLLSCVIIVLTWLLLAVLKRVITRPNFFLETIDKKRRMSIYLLVKYFIWIISLVLVLDAMGFKITIILAGSAALLVGIGLGFQHIFADLISGIFLLFEGTIKIGEIIEADGVVGRVIEINLRSSEVLTRDGVIIIIPNSKFVVEKVTNWSHNTDSVRFMVEVGVAYGTDVEKVFQYLEEVMLEHNLIEKEPVSFVRFSDFGESSLDFQMIFWTKETFRVESLKSDLRRGVSKKFAENRIEIPFPQRDLHIKSGLDKFYQRPEQLGEE
jgi:small-conductance mechanosensitive channel